MSSVTDLSHTSGHTSESVRISTVALYTAAVRSAVSRMRRTSSARAFLSFVRMVPRSTAVSGMMFAAVPAINCPIVKTHVFVGSLSRAMSSCKAR